MPFSIQPVPSGAPKRATLLRIGAAALLTVLLIGSAASVVCLRHYIRVVDRRLRHSAAFAARPRLRNVAHKQPDSGVHPASFSGTGQPARRLPAYDALPPQLIQAVVAIEDRRFFSHHGFDLVRTARCAVQDAVSEQALCGGSTITQQLARVDFLSQQKTVRRKVAELLIAHRLEQRLTKQQIFVMYATSINLGQRGPQPILGFRQASMVFFGQDLSRLTLSQYALLAGMIHAPNFDNPFRHPERARMRRNVVLVAMAQTGSITRAQAAAAMAEPLHLVGEDEPEEAYPPDPSQEG